MTTTLKLTISLSVVDALTTALQEVSLDGLGPDGTSTYEVSEVDVDDLGGGAYLATISVDRQEGKFVSKDELSEQFSGEISDLQIDGVVIELS